ncbi:hypothetical protein PCANC_21515, partial [Puccinia coronata f. sp. avenae]
GQSLTAHPRKGFKSRCLESQSDPSQPRDLSGGPRVESSTRTGLYSKSTPNITHPRPQSPCTSSTLHDPSLHDVVTLRNTLTPIPFHQPPYITPIRCS